MRLNIGTLIVIVSAAIVFFLYTYEAGMEWTPWRITGAAIAVPALVLLIVARLQLGDAFSVEARASRLVTGGLYARIRNPIYVFGGLMIVGIIVFTAQLWWLLVFAVLIPLQVWRSGKEARALEEKFGEEYRAWRRKTWF